MDRVVTAGDIEGAACDREGIVGVDGIRLGRDVVCAACDDHVVFTYDRVSDCRVDRKRTAAVDRQIVLGVDHGVDVILVDRFVLAAITESVFAFERDVDFVCGFHVDRCGRSTVDRSISKDQVDIVIFRIDLDDDHAVIGLSRYDIGTRFGDLYGTCCVGQVDELALGRVVSGLVIFIGDLQSHVADGRITGSGVCFCVVTGDLI